MCMKASCTTCNKDSWVGCGQHIPSVMDKVPEADRCTCGPKVEFEGKEYPPKAGSMLGGIGNLFGWGTAKKPAEAKKEDL